MSFKQALWKKILTFILPGLIVLPAISLAGSRITIKPEKLYPGDLFLIKTDYPAHSLIRAELNRREFHFSSCGERCSYAIGAIYMETRAGTYKLKIYLKNGKKMIKTLWIRKKEFPVLKLELPEDKVTLGPEDEARANREDELLRAIWQLRTERLWNGRFLRPLGNEVSTGFGVKRLINGHKFSIHKGIDIKAKEGEPVKAVNNGRVVLTEELFFGGKTVVIDHGEGLFSVYMHLSEYRVKEGDLVSAGEVIGLAGSTGRASGPHLHFGFKVEDISVNPESLFELKELP